MGAGMTTLEAHRTLTSAIWHAFAILTDRGEHSPEYAAAKASADEAREAYAAICSAINDAILAALDDANGGGP
jgi:hypothetical protein